MTEAKALRYDAALAEFMGTLDKKMTAKQRANEKRWFTNQMNAQRKHELKLKMYGWFQADPQAKYYIGAAAGAGTALVGTLLEDLTSEFAELGFGDAIADQQITPEFVINEGFAWLIPGMSTTATRELFASVGIGDSFKNASDLATSIPDILKLSGVGFAGLCSAEILLYAIFSGTDAGELIAAVGSLIPG